MGRRQGQAARGRALCLPPLPALPRRRGTFPPPPLSPPPFQQRTVTALGAIASDGVAPVVAGQARGAGRRCVVRARGTGTQTHTRTRGKKRARSPPFFLFYARAMSSFFSSSSLSVFHSPLPHPANPLTPPTPSHSMGICTSSPAEPGAVRAKSSKKTMTTVRQGERGGRLLGFAAAPARNPAPVPKQGRAGGGARPADPLDGGKGACRRWSRDANCRAPAPPLCPLLRGRAPRKKKHAGERPVAPAPQPHHPPPFSLSHLTLIPPQAEEARKSPHGVLGKPTDVSFLLRYPRTRRTRERERERE